METNLLNSVDNAKVPAGVFKGIELFTYDGEIYAIFDGVRMRFEELPAKERYVFVDQFLSDKKGQNFIKHNFGITGSAAVFKKWIFCKFGGLDYTPDLLNNEPIPDCFNNACKSLTCIGRGKFCSVGIGLKWYDIETIAYLKEGKTMKEVAEVLCLSEYAIKSRVEKLKIVFNVKNVVALIAIATDLGI